MDPIANNNDDGSSQALSEIIAQCLEHMELEGEIALERVCVEHPEMAPKIRAAVERVCATGLIRRTGAQSMPERLGDYRLLRELGSGGMGVVYLAEQERVARRVALKLIRPDHAFVQGAKERLLREVAAVGRLSHPGIVSVFDVGEEQGTPFYSMEFLPGCTLAELIEHFQGRDPGVIRGKEILAHIEHCAGDTTAADRPAHLFEGGWHQFVVRTISAVSAALSHAHDNSVLHRDVKPSNVMITPSGRIVLVDFGLARLPDAPKITRTGSTLGSLAYMAPEQLAQREVDARSDVYALGVTFFEALTLRPPFPIDQPSELHWRIARGIAPRPRSLVRSIPTDVETVCLKAMDSVPARRYQSARALTADLTNLLELRPIDARRSGPVLRTVRWAQRRPAAALSATLGVAILAGAPLLWTLAESRADDRVNQAEDLAQSTFSEAEEFVDRIAEQLRTQSFGGDKAALEVKAALADQARAQHQQLRAMKPEGQELLRRGLSLEVRFGRVLNDLSAAEQAKAAFTEALALFDRIEQPERDDWVRAAETHRSLIGLFQSQREPEEARAAGLASVAFFAAARQAHPTDGELADIEGATLYLRSTVAHRGRDYEERNRLLTAAMEIAQAAFDNDPSARNASQLGFYHAERGNFFRADDEPERASTDLQRAIELYDQAIAAEPENHRHPSRLAAAALPYSVVLQSLGQHDAAMDFLHQARATMQQVIDDNPDMVAYFGTMGAIINNLALIHRERSEHEQAIPLLDEAIGWQRRLLDADPENIYARNYLSSHLGNRALSQIALGDYENVGADADEIVELRGATGHVIAARILASSVRSCLADTELSEDLRAARVTDLRNTAIEHLAAARDGGVPVHNYINHAEYEPLAAHPDFAALRAPER